MGRMKEALEQVNNNICNAAAEYGARREDVWAVQEILEERYDLDCNIVPEEMARYVTGIKLMMSTGYSANELWEHWKDYLLSSTDADETLEQIWNDFKQTAHEHDL